MRQENALHFASDAMIAVKTSYRSLGGFVMPPGGV